MSHHLPPSSMSLFFAIDHAPYMAYRKKTKKLNPVGCEGGQRHIFFSTFYVCDVGRLRDKMEETDAHLPSVSRRIFGLSVEEN